MMTTTKSPSTKRLEKLKAFTCNDLSKGATISTSMAKPCLSGLKNALAIVPKWSLGNHAKYLAALSS